MLYTEIKTIFELFMEILYKHQYILSISDQKEAAIEAKKLNFGTILLTMRYINHYFINKRYLEISK